MLALASVWIALVTFLLSLVMIVYRPAFNDWTVPLVVMLGAPGALCLAGIVLWANRKAVGDDPAIAAQRTQAKVAIGLAILASTIVYLLVIFAARVPRD